MLILTLWDGSARTASSRPRLLLPQLLLHIYFCYSSRRRTRRTRRRARRRKNRSRRGLVHHVHRQYNHACYFCCCRCNCMQIAANCMALIAETLKDSGLPLLLPQFFANCVTPIAATLKDSLPGSNKTISTNCAKKASAVLLSFTKLGRLFSSIFGRPKMAVTSSSRLKLLEIFIHLFHFIFLSHIKVNEFTGSCHVGK